MPGGSRTSAEPAALSIQLSGLEHLPSSPVPVAVEVRAGKAVAPARRYGVPIDRTKGTDRLWYGVVSGDRISAEGKSLFDLYSSRQMLEWIRLAWGDLIPHARFVLPEPVARRC